MFGYNSMGRSNRNKNFNKNGNNKQQNFNKSNNNFKNYYIDAVPTAPYNFVRLNDKVIQPPLAEFILNNGYVTTNS